jgi:integrase
MRRKRKQVGCVFKDAQDFWVLRYRETVSVGGVVRTIQRARRLTAVGPNCKTKAAARRLAESQLKPINERQAPPINVITLGEFVENRYLPYCETHLRPSTTAGYRNLWLCYWKERCQNVWLRDVTTGDVIDWLTEIATERDLTKRTLNRIRHFLSGIFVHARTEKCLDEHQTNPAAGLKLPRLRARADGKTGEYTLAEVNRMLELLDDPAATLVALAAFTGLRRGELRGLRWEDYTPATPATSDEELGELGMIHVNRSVWCGHVTDPKSAESKNPVPLIPQAAHWLDGWRATSGDPETGFVFSNAKGKPRDIDALYRHAMAHTLSRAGVKWKGWHAFRRNLATRLDRDGAIDTVIQRVLRHEDVQTTRDHYIGKGTTSEAQQALRNSPKNRLIVLRRTEKRPVEGVTGVVQ